jgi:Beta-propeller repeat
MGGWANQGVGEMGGTRAAGAGGMGWLVVMGMLAGCNGSGITSVTVNTDRSTLQPGQSANLTATLLGTGDFSPNVTWTIDGGQPGLTVSGNTAMYTAPLVGAPTTVVIHAASVQDPSKTGSVSLTVSTALGVQVSASPTDLYAGGVSTLTATPSGGVPGVTWTIEAGGPGSVLASGANGAVYTAPAAISAQTTVVVRASSTADANVYGSAMLTLHPITVVISPDATRLFSGQTIGVNGTVNGPANVADGVQWSVVSGGGSLSATSGTDVKYTAPAVNAEQTVVLRATPTADPAQASELTLTVDHGWPAVIASGDGPDTARGVAVDATAFAVYVAGETGGSFDITQVGEGDGFVAKLDRYGNLAWVRQFGTLRPDFVTGVVADLNGNVYVSGHTIGRFDMTVPSGGSVGFVISYDKDGTFRWRQDVGPNVPPVSRSNDCAVYGLAMDTGGLLYAAGNCVQPALGFVQRCDATGCGAPNGKLTTVGPTVTPSSLAPAVQGVAVDIYGNYDLVGFSGSSGFVLQVSPSLCPDSSPCAPVWAGKVDVDQGSTGMVQLTSVTTDGTNVLAGGSTTGTVNGQMPQGGSDALLLLFDRTGGGGTAQWTQLLGTVGDDAVTGLAYDALFSRRLLATGTFDVLAPDSDAFLAFYAVDGSVPTPAVTFEPASPNPTTDRGGGVSVADPQGNLILGFTTSAQLGGPPNIYLQVGVRKVDAIGNPLSL